MASQPIAVELVDGACQRDGADHVGRAGLLPLGRVGPDHLVEVDEVDGAAAGQERVALGERRRGARCSTPAPNGAYILCPLQARKSAVAGQRPVGGELGGVDQHRHAPLVGGGDDVVERRQPAGDVGAPVMASSAGRGAGVERGDDVVGGERAVGAALDVAAPAADRAQGSRLAWCSTTVVTTTSSGASRSR